MNAMCKAALFALLFTFAQGADAAVAHLIGDVADERATHCEFVHDGTIDRVAVEVDLVRGDAHYGHRICRVSLTALTAGQHPYTVTATNETTRSATSSTCIYKSKLSSGRMQYARGQTMTCTAGGRCSIFCTEGS